MAAPPARGASGVDPLRLLITGLRTMLLLLSLWELALSNFLPLPPRLPTTSSSSSSSAVGTTTLPPTANAAPSSLLDMALNVNGEELRAASSALVGQGLLATALLLAVSLLLLLLRVSWDASTPFGGPWQRLFHPYFQQQHDQPDHHRAPTLLLIPALPPALLWFYRGGEGREGGDGGGRGKETLVWATRLAVVEGGRRM